MGVKLGLRVFQNMVLGWISGPKTDEVTGKWRRLNNEELYDLHSPNIIGSIKWRMRWAGYVARMADRRGAYRILVGWDLKESDHMEDLRVEGRIKLTGICKR